MKVIGLDHYNLCGPRDVLESMRDFYVEVLGLEVGYRPPFGSFGYWLYAADQPVLHVHAFAHQVRGGQHERLGEDGEDRDDNEQFDQCQAATLLGSATLASARIARLRIPAF